MEPDPARKINKSHRSVTGLFPSEKSERLIQFESTLERDLFAALECNEHVVRYHEQPCVVPFRSSLTHRKTTHVPDVLIAWHDGSFTLGDVKYSKDIAAKWPGIHEQFRAAFRYARTQGWRYRVYTEKRIRTTFNLNKIMLRDYRRHELTVPDVDLILSCLERPRTIESVVLEVGNEDQQTARATLIWSMLYRGLLEADLDEPLSMQTVISIK